MKELSIEQKAQRYDEAIKKLRDFYRDYNTISRLIDVKEELANLFPELKESKENKDKRVKKALSDILLIDSDEIREILDANNLLMQDIDSWLKNQGKQKSIDDLTQQEAMDIAVAKCFDEQKSDDIRTTGYWRVEDIEQKPAWSEEDEKMFECALNMIEWYSGVDESKSRSVSDWLKFLKNRVQPKQNKL